jgi:fucose permease
VNILGRRTAICAGCGGYKLVIAMSIICNYTNSPGVMIFAYVVSGACAPLLWTAALSLVLEHGLPNSKGRGLAVATIVFILGTVIGNVVSQPDVTAMHRAKLGPDRVREVATFTRRSRSDCVLRDLSHPLVLRHGSGMGFDVAK